MFSRCSSMAESSAFSKSMRGSNSGSCSPISRYTRGFRCLERKWICAPNSVHARCKSSTQVLSSPARIGRTRQRSKSSIAVLNSISDFWQSFVEDAVRELELADMATPVTNGGEVFIKQRQTLCRGPIVQELLVIQRSHWSLGPHRFGDHVDKYGQK